MQQNCESFEQNGTIARYVAGTAASAEARAFEEHYITCDQCYHALALGAGIRASLRDDRQGVIKLESRRGRTLFGWIGAVALAAALSGILFLRTSSLRRIESLGAIGAAPVYGGVAVRAAEDVPADQQFERGMAAYAAGQYGDAARLLNQALEAGLEPLPALFFLGISRLELDDSEGAVANLKGVLAQGDSPYYSEAQYYLAKALLRLRQADAARDQLEQAARSSSPIAPGARALADSVQRVGSRFFSRF